MTLDRKAHIQISALLVLVLFAAAPTRAENQPPQPCTLVEGHSQAKFAELVDRIRDGHDFYQRVVKLKGAPSACSGTLEEEQRDGDDWLLEFSWPDQSKLEIRTMIPETSIVHFTRAKGLTRPDAVINLTRQYSAEVGLKIDWAASSRTQKGEFAVIEYTSPTSPNAFVRFTYDQQQRLVGAWVSIAD